MTLNLHTIIVSTRPSRKGPLVARWFHDYAVANGRFNASLIDLTAFDLPVFDEPEHPRLRKYVKDHTRRWSASVESADAFVFVTPEYNYGPPPSFFNAMSYLSGEWAYKPAAFVSYGGISGGLRAAQIEKLTMTTLKMMPIPEPNTSIFAERGFNIIATANNRDKGVNELSSALKRRFNVVVLPLPETAAEEVAIIVKRVGEMAVNLDLPAPKNVAEEVARVVAIFRELRSGSTEDGKVALKTPSGGLSTAEAIGVMVGGLSEATFFNQGRLTPDTLASNMIGAVVKDPVQDRAVLGEYLETVLKKRPGFEGYYTSLTERI